MTAPETRTQTRESEIMKELDTLTSAEIVHLHGCSGFDRKTRFVSAADVTDLRAQRDSAVLALVALREAAQDSVHALAAYLNEGDGTDYMDTGAALALIGAAREWLTDAIEAATPDQEHAHLEAEILGTK